jgi:hypothetical protein
MTKEKTKEIKRLKKAYFDALKGLDDAYEEFYKTLGGTEANRKASKKIAVAKKKLNDALDKCSKALPDI